MLDAGPNSDEKNKDFRLPLHQADPEVSLTNGVVPDQHLARPQ